MKMEKGNNHDKCRMESTKSSCSSLFTLFSYILCFFHFYYPFAGSLLVLPSAAAANLFNRRIHRVTFNIQTGLSRHHHSQQQNEFLPCLYIA